MVLEVPDNSEFQVLIVGAGPVGLGLAIELGLRGVRTLVVEQSDGTFKHPRANAINVRTMEFCRRWSVADAVRAQGMPADFPHTVLYLTSLAGFEIARIERPAHGGGASSPFSPERPQRCNQLWFDPILRDRAASLPSVTVRNRVRFDLFEQTDDGIVAEINDLKTGKVLHKVDVRGFEKGRVKRHGCPSHGIGMTPDGTRLWVSDGANSHMHIFDLTVEPPEQIASVKLRGQPGWVTFSIDGTLAYPSSGDVFDAKTLRVITQLTDEKGRMVMSEKLLEIDFVGNDAVRAGDQFGIGNMPARAER